MGCQENKEANQTEVNELKEEENKNHRTVYAVKVIEAPKTITSPAEAVVHQFEVIFTNGEKAFLNKDAVISEAILGSKSIVTVHSPEGKNHYRVFLYEHKDKWFMDSLLAINAWKDGPFTDKEGLNLPMDTFNKTDFKHDGKEIWAFVDEQRIVTISVFDKLSFEKRPETNSVTLNNGNEAYLSRGSQGNDYLYYFDFDKVILVSGNLEKNEIVSLANSLPSVDSFDFPHSASY
ncbi:hypothetical protein LC040_02120 [Bacillus tianshenii]|nr:hypothetical protein LC040_02120 [Bacillus tianshenii]